MKRAILATGMFLALALSGCTDGPADPGDVEAPPYQGPKAEIWHSDVGPGSLDGGTDDFVECETETRLYVQYTAGDPPSDKNESSDFSVRVYSESSRRGANDSGYQGILVWPFEDEEGTFSGLETGEFQTDITWGSAGLWKLNVQRSTFHAGDFIVRLTCLN